MYTRHFLSTFEKNFIIKQDIPKTFEFDIFATLTLSWNFRKYKNFWKILEAFFPFPLENSEVFKGFLNCLFWLLTLDLIEKDYNIYQSNAN